jgi:uncharacterized protein (TIGR03435 family)
MRAEAKRRRQEKEFQMQTEFQSASTDELWKQMSPLLDEALASLGEKDRQAMLLRFFENKSLAEVGNYLGIGEDTARKRVARALEKLRKFFTRRGVSSTTAIIAGAISANSIQAAPVALAKSVTAVAIAKGAAASTSTLTLIKGALKIMAWSKAKTAIVAGIVVLLASGTTTVAIKNFKSSNGAQGIDAYISDINLEDYEKAPPLLVIQPTHFQKYQGIMGRFVPSDGKFVGRDRTIKDIIATAYDFHTPRIIFPDQMPTNHYDFLVTVPDHSREQFQSEIKKVLGYTAQTQTRVEDVLVLNVADSGIGKLKPGGVAQNSRIDPIHGPDRNAPEINYPNNFISALAEQLEYQFRIPVIDQTRLVGLYNMVLDWHWQRGRWQGARGVENREANLNSIKKALLDQFGLELVSTNMPVEMLVVEKVK